jgi:hypothetical protein
MESPPALDVCFGEICLDKVRCGFLGAVVQARKDLDQ